jgi:prenylcysteine oxidase/farnesylcysteine lyase
LTIELGASIYVELNHIVANLVNEFNLTGLSGPEAKKVRTKGASSSNTLGLWPKLNDFRLYDLNSYKDQARFLWDYGLLTIRRVRRVADEAANSFLYLYELAAGKSVANFVEPVKHLTGNSARDVLGYQDVNVKYLTHVAEGISLCNYRQTLEINALGALVGLISSEVRTVVEGNQRIWEHAIKSTSSSVLTKVHTNTPVKHILYYTTKQTYLVDSMVGEDALVREEYDLVVIATPLVRCSSNMATVESPR